MAFSVCLHLCPMCLHLTPSEQQPCSPAYSWHVSFPLALHSAPCFHLPPLNMTRPAPGQFCYPSAACPTTCHRLDHWGSCLFCFQAFLCLSKISSRKPRVAFALVAVLGHTHRESLFLLPSRPLRTLQVFSLVLKLSGLTESTQGGS